MANREDEILVLKVRIEAPANAVVPDWNDSEYIRFTRGEERYCKHVQQRLLTMLRERHPEIEVSAEGP